MNDAEERYSRMLEARRLGGEIERWRYEAVKLRLAHGAWYTCDFWVVLADGLIEMHEFKGHQREAGRVRLKVAAAAYPELRFIQVTERYAGRRALGLYNFEEIPPW
jgi:hypothetical protein